jgi:hypothetical protein
MALAFLIVIAALAASGAFGSGASGPNVPVPFSSARATALSSLPGGPWELVIAIGISEWEPFTVPTNISTVPANCTAVFSPNPPPASILFPSHSGNMTSGVAPVWEFAFVNSADTAVGEAIVVNGEVAIAGELSGPGCPASSLGPSLLPSDVIDSSVAAQSAARDGASAFLAAHPINVSLYMALEKPEPSNASPVWYFLYSTCSDPLGLVGNPPPGPAVGTAVAVTINAATGSVVSAYNDTDETCPT